MIFDLASEAVSTHNVISRMDPASSEPITSCALRQEGSSTHSALRRTLRRGSRTDEATVEADDCHVSYISFALSGTLRTTAAVVTAEQRAHNTAAVLLLVVEERANTRRFFGGWLSFA